MEVTNKEKAILGEVVAAKYGSTNMDGSLNMSQYLTGVSVWKE